MTIYAAMWLFDFGHVAANIVGYSVGLFVSFALNSRWTFAYQGAQVPALIKFIIVTLIAYGMNLGTVLIAIRYFDLNAYVAQALGIPPYTFTLYLASKYLVFRSESENNG